MSREQPPRFDQDEIRDDERSYARFRSTVITEANEAIEKLVRKAFMAGFEAGSGKRAEGIGIPVLSQDKPAPATPWAVSSTSDSLCDRHFGRQTRVFISRFRSALFGSRIGQDHPMNLRPEDLAIILHPRERAPGGYGKESWVLPATPNEPAGTKAANKFASLGLLQILPLDNGWAAGWLTEWGYDLVRHGVTPATEHRTPGSSPSFWEWQCLMSSYPHPALRAARSLGVLEQIATAWPRGPEKDIEDFPASPEPV